MACRRSSRLRRAGDRLVSAYKNLFYRPRFFPADVLCQYMCLIESALKLARPMQRNRTQRHRMIGIECKHLACRFDHRIRQNIGERRNALVLERADGFAQQGDER